MNITRRLWSINLVIDDEKKGVVRRGTAEAKLNKFLKDVEAENLSVRSYSQRVANIKRKLKSLEKTSPHPTESYFDEAEKSGEPGRVFRATPQKPVLSPEVAGIDFVGTKSVIGGPVCKECRRISKYDDTPAQLLVPGEATLVGHDADDEDTSGAAYTWVPLCKRHAEGWFKPYTFIGPVYGLTKVFDPGEPTKK